MNDNYFAKLNDINVNDKTEKKGNLTYLSWAWAWGEIKKLFPDATYTVYENANGCFYHTDGHTCWVKTGVTVNGIEHIEYLPVMDYNNRSITLDKVTSFDVNKAIQRSLTKACARHGLGLYIYAGEDLPECEDAPNPEPEKKSGSPKSEEKVDPPKKEKKEETVEIPAKCESCGNTIMPQLYDGKKWSAEAIIRSSKKKYGRALCWDCAMKANEN